MTRPCVLACIAALLLPGRLSAQERETRAARDGACAAWRVALHERGTAALGERLDRTGGCRVDAPTIVLLWRTAGPDTAQLTALRSVTGAEGGARALRAVLQTLAERRRPTAVRLAALAALVPYLMPGEGCAGRLLDTLRGRGGSCWLSHPSYHASSSIEPVLRDSIRARLRDASSEPGAVGRAAASLLGDPSLPERWSERRAAWCRRAGAAFAPALRMGAAALASPELHELAGCTESGPAALALAWRAAPADTATLTALVRISADVRDERLYRALLDVARDRVRPTAVRVAAVDAVAPLLHPALYWFSTARARSDPPSRPCSTWGGYWHEAVQEEGAAPMGPASRRRGVAELVRLSGENVPPPVADAARTVAGCARRLLDARQPEAW